MRSMKMKEIGRAGTKRNNTPENTQEHHSEKPKGNPRENQPQEHHTNLATQTTGKTTIKQKRKSAEE